MNAAQLAAALGVGRQQITAWLKQGMPSAGTSAKRIFEPPAVRDWLVASGFAAAADQSAHPPAENRGDVARSLAEVARAFRVSERTAAGWRARGMPGEPGNYPIAAIEAWKSANVEGSEAAKRAQARLMHARAEVEELKLQQLRGVLANVHDQSALTERSVAHATALLDQVPDRARGWLPDYIKADDREEFCKRLEGAIDDARAAHAAVLEEWAEQLAKLPRPTEPTT